MFWNDLWTIDLQRRRVNVKFWPWIFSTTCFIAVLINNNISHQILRFFMLKKSVGLMTNEEIISKLPYSKPFLFVDEITEINENGVEATLLSMKT
jgi:hypothetical protein